MTILAVCAVRDSAVQAFMQPIFVPHVGHAVRSFQDECKKSDSVIAAHPSDYELFEIGSYDDSSGLMRPFEVPRSLVRGADVA